MNKVFFIGDTHFGHKGILKFDSTKPFRNFESIQDHDDELIKRWNNVVKKNDTVWVLGDFCFGRENIAIANKLNGWKKLVMGNHDVYSADYIYSKYFEKVYGAIEYKSMILTHIPVHESQFSRYSKNIHGHLHSNKIDDKRYINVSAEQIDLTPISYENLMEKYKC